MMLNPIERFLGVAPDADASTLLSLAPPINDATAIDHALRIRIAQTFSHPDGRSPEAESVRDALREAARTMQAQLKMHRQDLGATGARSSGWMQQAVRSRRPQRSAAPTPLNLTAFDKLVLATLVACGGWNARCRAQLVALAQQYGVTVQGLLRVMQGLSDYARSGGQRIGVTDIANRASTTPLTPVGFAAPPPVGIALLDRLAENLGHELKRGGAWPTIKLAIFFGIVTVVVGVVSLRAIFSRSDPPADGEQSIAAIGDHVSPGAGPASAPARETNAPATAIARFPSPPTFLGNGLPAEAVNAVDRLPNLAAQIDELGRKIAVAHGEPSESVYRQWDADMNTIALAWSIGETSVTQKIDQAMFETLRAAGDTPIVSDRLLKTLVPPASVSVPTDLIRGTYMTGALARIAAASTLPPVVSERARSLLEIVLSQNVRGSMSSTEAGDLWLMQRLPQLVQMLVLDERTYDTWELWLTSQRALGAGDRFEQALATALRAILETDYDLGSPGPAINVAARLMSLLLQSGSAVSRQRMLDFFDDDQVAARDLWVLSSLLTSSEHAPWFPDRLVVPDDADMAHRWRIRDDLSKAWPAPKAQSLADAREQSAPLIDAMEGTRWAIAVEDVLAEPAGSDQTALMHQIIDAGRLVEAALALLAEMPDEARRLIDQVEAGWSAAVPVAPGSRPPLHRGPAGGGGGSGGGQSPVRSGQPIGADGAWSSRYAEAGRNADARLELIRLLRSTAGTDLGPIDSATLVREAYRGSPQEVRSLAQAVIEQQFITGPNIAMQLLDQLAEAPATDSVSEMIQGVTNQLLPGVRTSSWQAEARLALVTHAIALRDQHGTPVDSLLEPLTESFAGRLALAQGEAGVLATASSPQEAAALLVRALTGQAEFAAPMEPVPSDLSTLQRRHHSRLALADGPIQAFVAQQLAILDLLTFLTVAEQPRVKDRAIEILDSNARKRLDAKGVLEQSRSIELATLEICRIRLGLDPELELTAPAEDSP